MRGRLLLLFLALCLPTAAGEPHNPITIDAQTVGILPDGLAGHGIRSGTGMANDPYVISGWEITAAGQPALQVTGTQAYILVEGVTITGDGSSDSGIVIRNAPNVLVRSIDLQDLHNGIAVIGGAVQLEGITLRDITRPATSTNAWGNEPVALYVQDAVVLLENLDLDGAGMGAIIHSPSASLSRVTMRDIASLGIDISGPGEGEIALDDVSVRGSKSVDPCLTDGPYEATVGVRIHPAGLRRAILNDVDAGGWDFGIAVAPPDDEVSSVSLAAVGVNVSGNVIGLSIVSPATDASVQGAFESNGVGLEFVPLFHGVASTLVINASRFVGNGVGLDIKAVPPEDEPIDSSFAERNEAGIEARVAIGGSDLVDNCSWAIRNRIPQDVTVEALGNYWNPAPSSESPNRVSDGVRAGNRASDPQAGAPIGNGHDAPAGFTAAILGLALAALKRRG